MEFAEGITFGRIRQDGGGPQTVGVRVHRQRSLALPMASSDTRDSGERLRPFILPLNYPVDAIEPRIFRLSRPSYRKPNGVSQLCS